jgi:cell division protein ZapA
MGELLSIKVSIANRSYPLRITAEEQHKVMHAAENINKRVKEFEDNYAVKDKQDLLAMAALQFANEAADGKTEKNDSSVQDAKDNIEYLSLLLDEYLSAQDSTI